MPAGHMRWPASDKLIFEINPARRTRTPDVLRIDESFLWSFGEPRVPSQIWHALCHHNVWIEPVLVAEWIRLMEGYAPGYLTGIREKASMLLAWADPEHDTRLARAAVERIRSEGNAVYCEWSGNRLREDFDIDHCFPFSAWPCGDAWNLMPASKKINVEKSNRLVTRRALETATDGIIHWWANAYLAQSPASSTQFFLEAAQTLPIFSAAPDVHAVIDAMKINRIRLNNDQGLRSWEPKL